MKLFSYSHRGNLLLKGILFIVFIGVIIGSLFLLDDVDVSDMVGIVLFIGAMVFAVILNIWLYDIFAPISSKFYFLINFGIRLSYGEAKKLAKYTDPASGRWFTFSELDKIPEKERKAALMDFISKKKKY